MNQITEVNDTVTKHLLSTTNPTGFSRLMEILYELSENGHLPKNIDIQQITQIYKSKFEKGRESHIKRLFILASKLGFLNERGIIDVEIASGCYGDKITPDAKYKIIRCLYQCSKLFREFMKSLITGAYRIEDLYDQTVKIHGLNQTAKQKFSECVNALGVLENFCGKAELSRWVETKSLAKITTKNVYDVLKHIEKKYGENYLILYDNFRDELMDYLAQGTISNKTIAEIIRSLDSKRIISIQQGKDFKLFIRINSSINFEKEMSLSDFLKSPFY